MSGEQAEDHSLTGCLLSCGPRSLTVRGSVWSTVMYQFSPAREGALTELRACLPRVRLVFGRAAGVRQTAPGGHRRRGGLIGCRPARYLDLAPELLAVPLELPGAADRVRP